MFVKMLKDTQGSENGLEVKLYVKDTVYDLPEDLAKTFINIEAAVKSDVVKPLKEEVISPLNARVKKMVDKLDKALDSTKNVVNKALKGSDYENKGVDAKPNPPPSPQPVTPPPTTPPSVPKPSATSEDESMDTDKG